MAKKHVTIFIDDVTGEETSEGATHAFTLNGVEYEIDLSPDSYDRMLEVFSPYLKAGRKTGRKGQGEARRKQAVETGGQSAARIREWAKANGHDVSERGRIPAEVREAYEAAQ
ncbi:Lsr2 family protein [Streptomyces sp. NPDC091376]|uniref:histone-like nucleoid-structuring protein Lsr2 n=1 Tax=Streptomyces sp. NPDC091376 TaxID=3365994 RepID=UPI003812B89B